MAKKRRSPTRRNRTKYKSLVPAPRPEAGPARAQAAASVEPAVAVRVQAVQVSDGACADGFYVEELGGSRGQASCDFVIPGAPVPGVQLGFGKLYAEQRRRSIAEGYGFSVEVPAVLDLLASVESGATTVAAVRGLFLESAAQLYRPLGCVHAETADEIMAVCLAKDGCALCEHYRGHFESMLDECDERWSRLRRPEEFPFAVSRKGVHTVGCHIVRREAPETYARPAGSFYLDALREYSHSVDRRSDPWDFEGAHRYPRIKALGAREMREWIDERTGPKGGLYYKRCQRCSPAL
ncbi:hypothetical protein ACFYVL_35755 [Streptomyces sp. NPDC004111]|uniref:hypothetical protein n=1 Tax=Streptomyces sp. NPDC004111 TaxID=3364690 RepID=UPI0036B12359